MITPTVRLDPSVAILPRRDGTVQLGWSPETSVVVTPPPDAEPGSILAILRLLAAGHSRPHIVCHAMTLGLSANRTSAMLGELEESGLLVHGTSGPIAADTSRRVPPEVPETVNTVHLVGRGPISDALASGLSRTSATVSRSSLTPTRYPQSAVSSWDYDIVVLADDLVAEPRLVTDLVRLRIPHLQVRLRDGKGLVGPFVLPGRTSCLRCADLTRCDFEPEWPHLSAQLLGTVGQASSATVLATAAFAFAQLESLIGRTDAALPETADCTMELNFAATGTTVHRRLWSKHPHCDCWH
ncbi:putative uncharacterized protein [Rhodococcus sp. AW25M09]|uniref:hypothetical protein n=1 Tax=Rhodococcus sp. AW25M09 TaxID=1268303 RepID=UPI0002AD0F42|nr:hypothetical protein [Rhodococcus sp. AW25M09]CCQ17046.1 putative uncharacterized protein [Rhodococcus sp. AW25M09]